MVVRLKDIAGELGVSVPLVSKVLNNSQGTIGVSERTAQLIRDTAQQMGYVRNRSAASLTQGRQNALALLMHFSGVPGSRNNEDLLEGVSDSARKYDQHLELTFFKSDEECSRAIKRLNTSSIDGIILAGAAHPGILEKIVEVMDSGLPVISIHSSGVFPEVPNVSCDQIEVGRLAVSHLIERGCSRIASINMMADRHEGYRLGLENASMAYDPQLVYDVDNRDALKFDKGLEAVASLMDTGVEFDGLVTHCDLHAVAALHILKMRGIDVPSQVKVTGVDNSLFARESTPSVTSISECLSTQASVAVDLLMEAVSGKEISSRAVVPQLIARASTQRA